jgi:hypothetical protein
VLGSTAIVLCVYVITFRGSLVVAAPVLAVRTYLRRVLSLGTHSNWFSILNIVGSFVFDVFIAVVIFRRVLAPSSRTRKPSSERFAFYLLAGFAFASIYGMVALLQPHAFYLDPLANKHDSLAA